MSSCAKIMHEIRILCALSYIEASCENVLATCFCCIHETSKLEAQLSVPCHPHAAMIQLSVMGCSGSAVIDYFWDGVFDLTSVQGASEAAMQSRSMSAELRSSLLKLTVEGYEHSGYLWENYDENSGSGRGCRPFTGWSALMVLIAADDVSWQI